MALEVEPKYADALEAIGKIYFERNDFKKAVAYYQQAIDADPARVSERALIGDAQMKMEDWAGAIASYLQALDADPDLKQAFSKLGQAYQEKKQWPKAIEWYRKASRRGARERRGVEGAGLALQGHEEEQGSDHRVQEVPRAASGSRRQEGDPGRGRFLPAVKKER